MTSSEHESAGDLIALAANVATVGELAELLRALRRREARERNGPLLTYQQLAGRAGLAVATIGAYLSGVAVAPADRFDTLLLVLGARPHERGPFATARDRVADHRRPGRAVAGAISSSMRAATAQPARMLPAALADFTGRTGLISRLDALLGSAPHAVLLTAIAGMGGVGKTALAVHWGHSVAPHFPDGQLYVNLRGYDAGAPLSTVDALGVLLNGMGAPPGALPGDLAGRLSLYRSLLRGRRALVLLDNASPSADLRSLLPPAPCLALVTSRDDLPALDGAAARRIRLDVFAADEAVALLRRLIGVRADESPEAVRALARRCGYLPLAVRVVAELAVFREDVALSALVDELDSDYEDAGLAAFASTGDARSDVHTVFSWSVRWLPGPAARAFRLLGLAPGRDIDEYGLAALAGVTPVEAAEFAATLRRAHLVDSWPPGRYSMHDLVRAYAHESAERDLDPADRRDALTRLFDYYLAAVAEAVEAKWPGNRTPPGPHRPAPLVPVQLPDLAALPDASAWLAAERANVVAACVHAADNGWAQHAMEIAIAVWLVLDDAHGTDALTVHEAALAAADRLGDACAAGDRARVLTLLALTNYRLGNLEDAAVQAEQAIATGRRVGATSFALSLTVLGSVRSAEGRFRDALAAFEEVLAVAASREPWRRITPMLNLAQVMLDMERYDAALDHAREAVRLAEALELGESGEGYRCVAAALIGLGCFDEALPAAERALATVRRLGYALKLTTTLDTMAQACRGAGLLGDAIDYLAEAVDGCRELASPRPSAQVLNTLGETYRDAGEHELARRTHDEALEFARLAKDRREIARALFGRGDAHAAAGDLPQARLLWQEARGHIVAMDLSLSMALVETRLREADPR